VRTVSASSFRMGQTRLVANSRVVMAAVTLAATYFDPSQPSRYPQAAYLLLLGYLLYAASFAFARSRRDRPNGRLDYAEHLFDLSVFTALIYMIEGLTSPFFPLFTYSLLVAHLRWGWRGTLATGAAVICIFLSKLHEPDPDVGYILVRCVYLAVIAVLIAWIGGRQESFHNKVARTAGWPPPVYVGETTSLAPLLGYAADVMRAPRVLLAWHSHEDQVLNLLRWEAGRLDHQQAPLGDGTQILRGEFSGKALLSIHGRRSTTLQATDAGGVRHWHGPALDPEFARRHAPGSVLILTIEDGEQRRYLIIGGRSDFSSDDLLVGEVVAGHVSARMTELRLLERLRLAAVANERIKLARDLHDGVLQSLTAARLQLHSLRRLLGDPAETAERLFAVEAAMERDQKALREFIAQLKPEVWEESPSLRRLSDELQELAGILSDRWGLRIVWTVRPADLAVMPTTAYELRRVIEEGTANAKRHGDCHSVEIDIATEEHGIRLLITDDGRGFDVQPGNALTIAQPRNLSERVVSMGGTLNIHSAAGKTTVEVTVPAHSGSMA
jgi:signal transduction histidine kinase